MAYALKTASGLGVDAEMKVCLNLPTAAQGKGKESVIAKGRRYAPAGGDGREE